MTQKKVSSADSMAAHRLVDALSPETIDALSADAKSSGTPIDGAEGLLNQLTKAVVERALMAELTDHLGYDHGDSTGNGPDNSRNGHSEKTMSTTTGPVRLQIPRDRNDSFEPQIVPKRARRIGQIDEMILSLYSRGTTTRDIHDHLAEVYGVNASPALISTITDVVVEEITWWQNRPVDQVYPIVYVDAIRVRIRDGDPEDRAPGRGRGRRGPQARAGHLDRRQRISEVLEPGPHPIA